MKSDKKVRFKIGGVPEHFNLPWKEGMEDGAFRAENIQLHWEDISGGTGQMLRGLENKSLDVAVLLTEGITKAILQGLDATILQIYVTSSLHWGIHVPFKGGAKSISELEDGTFAISREGSGSHLMSYVLADQQGWDTNKLKFNIIGDVYGGLWALENHEAQAFLWEKYTTRPHVEQEKCNYIGDVVTPWPCFCIAVRNEVLKENSDALQAMCKIVNQKAKELKNHPEAVETISWRYGLKSKDVQNWLNETNWNYSGAEDLESFEKTVDYLCKLGLVNQQEAENWEQKLFAKKKH